MNCTRNFQVIHPSFLILAGPLVPAAAFFLGGAYHGALQSTQSVPALILLVSTYFLSRWFRRSSIAINEDSVTLGDKTLRFDDIAEVEQLPRPAGLPSPDRMALYDRNRVHRLTLVPAAYGERLRSAFKARKDGPKLPEPSTADRAVAVLFVASSVACLAAATVSFFQSG